MEVISYIWLYDLIIYNLFKHIPFFQVINMVLTIKTSVPAPLLCQVIGFGNACGTIACLPTARMINGRKTDLFFGHGKNHGNHQLLKPTLW